MMRNPALLALALLAACSREAPPDAASNTATAAPSSAQASGAPVATAPVDSVATAAHVTDAYLGRWIGVEGMYLVVAPAALPGQYELEMQWDLDHTGKFAGTAEGGVIAFTRDGARLALRPTNGDATGLKYLDGKTRCLTVKSGEGYCRD